MFESIRALFNPKPSRQVMRREARIDAKRALDAASGARRGRGWGETPSLQSAILAGGERTRRRGQDAVINNGLAASGQSVTVSESIGSGLRPAATTGDAGLNKDLDARFQEWATRSDYFGTTDFYGWQALACGRVFVDGEHFCMMTTDETGELRLKPLDPAQLYSALNQELPGGGLIVAGVQVTPGGKPIAFHVYTRWIPSLPLLTGLEATVIPAADMIHVFSASTPGQVRGVSALAPVLLRLREYDRLVDAQLVRQKIGAMLAGFLTTVDGGGALGDQMTPGEVTLEPGLMTRLAPGKSVEFSKPLDIGSKSNEFQNTIIREIAAGIGVPSFLLDGNMGQVHFSSARVALISFRRRLEQWQGMFVHQALRPIYRRFITLEILSGKLSAPLNEATLAHRWIPPKSVWVDMLKDCEAEVLAINNGLLSSREAVGARGYSIEELDAEISADRAREKALGIDFTPQPQKQTGADNANAA